MQRTAASRFLILLLICGMVLALPGMLFAAADGQAPGCSHCQGSGPGLSAGCCCCLPGTPGHCGSGQNGAATCRCPAGQAPVFIPQGVLAAPTWQVSPCVIAMATVSSKLFSPHIFHPPEFPVC